MARKNGDKYIVEFSPKFPPYQTHDRWQVGFNVKAGLLAGFMVVEWFETEKEAREYCEKLNNEKQKGGEQDDTT